jgi:16S rRNA processing protein RimM
MSRTDRTIVVAQFGAAHGIKGEVRLKSFTANPVDVTRYAPLAAKDGRTFEITSARPAAGSSSPDMLVVRVKGVSDRSAAEKLNRIELSVPFDRLPPPDDGEYYHADLIGLTAVTPDGVELGTIIAVPNYGAGDLLEIAPPRGQSLLILFNDAHVPEVDIPGGRVVVVPPVFDTDTGAGDDKGDDEDEATP